MIALLCFARMGMAQEPPPTPDPEQEVEPRPEEEVQPAEEAKPEEQAEPSDGMPIPVPIAVQEETGSLGDMTFIDDVFQSPRNRWGFSLSAYEAYTTDVFVGDEPRESSGITAFMPRVFLNLGKRKSRLHLDLGVGFRLYNNHGELNSGDYYAGAQYSYQLSKKTSFQLGDQFTSTYNDAWSFLSLYSPLHYDPASSNEVLLNMQRINRNSAVARLSHEINRKARFSVFGSHQWYDYSQSTLSNSDSVEAGGNFYYRMAKWLYFSSSISTYWNFASEDLSDTRIYRLQIGGLEFELGNSWRVWASGGIGFSDYEGYNRAFEDINAGIGHTSENASFSLRYQRGFTTAIGISELLTSDIFTANYGYRVTRWMNAHLRAYYYRSSQLDRDSLLETFSGGGGLEFALRRNLSLTMNASYQNQQESDFSVQGLDLNRFGGYIGLQYVWPSRRRN